MLYAIHAYDNYYGGLHGIEKNVVVEVKNEEEAHEIAKELSLEVIEDFDIFSEIEDTLENEDDVEEWINQDIAYEIYLIKETNKSLEELDYLFWNDPEEFIEEYCISEI